MANIEASLAKNIKTNDDIIIGFAERGERVTNANSNSTFPAIATADTPVNEVLQGTYQLEIRRAAEYATPLQSTPLELEDIELLLERTFDTNDRLADAVTIVAPHGSDIADGQTLTLTDGIQDVTLVFEELVPLTSSGGAYIVESGNTISEALDSDLVAGANGSFRARGIVAPSTDVDFFAVKLIY